jgi:hypothetical protein
MMDNEASKGLKDFLVKDNNIQYQLVPPHIHRRNAAERAIRTFKNHFIAGLCSTNPDFPLRLRDKLLPQAETTLNLLRAARVQPNMSAYEIMFGAYDYNKHPLMPPGTKVVVHEKPGQQASWDPHGKQGWYIGPAMEHYRGHRCHINATNAERISETVEFFHHVDPIPTITPHEATIIAAEALQKALRQRIPPENLQQLLHPTTATLQQLQSFIHCNDSEEAQNPTAQRNTGSPRVPELPRVPKERTENGTAQPIAMRTRNAQAKYILENYFANAVAHPTTGKLMEYRQLITDPTTKETWQLSAANEFGRLAQGVGGRVKGTNTITFIQHHEMPQDREATYPRFVCSERPQKTEKYRTRMTIGGNRIDYPGDKSTRTAELETTKILLNSVISTAEAKFCTMDITNFYLNTPLDRPEYLRIPVNLIPTEIMNEYNLETKVKNGTVLAHIDKGMYGRNTSKQTAETTTRTTRIPRMHAHPWPLET